MRTRRPLYLGALLLVISTTAQAIPYCDDIACRIPPRAYCTEECLDCQLGGGPEYPGGFDGQGGGCENPTVITVADCGCPCLQGTMPALDLGQQPSPGLPLLDRLLSLPPAAEGPQSKQAPAAGEPSGPPAGGASKAVDR